MKKEIHIFAGHYGSGKTNVAINFAFEQRAEGKRTVIIDIDTVNPYFRTNDQAKEIRDRDIEVIASEFASTNIDMPTVPPRVSGVFEDESEAVIFDSGGDDEGAYVLGMYREKFEASGYKMHLVVNTRRPLTQTAADLYEMARDIEKACGLKFSDIYNNTNLAYMTDKDVLLSGMSEIEKLSEMLNIPISRHCGSEEVVEGIENGMKMEIMRKEQ